MSSLFFDEIVLSTPPPMNVNDYNLYCFENIRFLSQNCNSLNLSVNHLNRDKGKCNIKISSILKNEAKIICLQDTRVSKYENKLKNIISLNKFGSYSLF